MNVPSTEQKKGRRRFLRLLLAVLVLAPLLAVTVALVALKTRPGRQAVLERTGGEIEEIAGLRLDAADFDVRVAAGVLEFESLTLAVGDAEPFLAVDHLRIDLDWTSRPLLVHRILVERPVLDLRRPLPELAASGGEPPEAAVEIGELRLTGGEIRGTAVPAGAGGEPYLRDFSATGVELAGSLTAGRLDLELTSALVRLVRSAAPQLDVDVSGRLAGDLAGPYTLDALRVHGSGLDLSASGEVGTGEDDPLVVRLDLTADPSLALTDLGPGGRLRVDGEVDLRRFRGELTVSAQDFPSAALEPWIGEAGRPGGEPSWIDLEARLKSDPAATPQVTGDGELAWRREGGELLAGATFEITEGRLDEWGVVLESLAGEVRADAAGVPAELLRPWLGDRLDEVGAAGTVLDAGADLSLSAAAPDEPRGRFELAWRRGGEVLLAAAAETVDDATTGLVLDFEATLLAAEPGHRGVTGRLAAPSWPEIAAGELLATRLDLELPDARAALADVRRRWPALFADLEPGAAERIFGALDATAQVSGPVDAPAVELDATWTAGEASAVLDAAGRPLTRRGEGTLTFERLDLGRFAETLNGEAGGTLRLSGSPDGARGDLVLDAAALEFGEKLPPVEDLHVEMVADGETLVLTAFSGTWGEARFSGSAEAGIDEVLRGGKLRRAGLRLDVERPVTGVDRAELEVALVDGVLSIHRLGVASPTGSGELAGEIPLGALRQVPGVGEGIDGWGVALADGAAVLNFAFPELDLSALFLDFGREPPWTAHRASLVGRLWLEPELRRSEVELIVEDWFLDSAGHQLRSDGEPIVLSLADGRLTLDRVRIATDGGPLTLAATVELRPEWRRGDDPADLAGTVDASAEGVLDGALLSPYLAGGVAEGPVHLDARLTGPPGRRVARAVFDGPEAAIVYRDPYLTRFQAPHVELEVADGAWTFRDVYARLNDGSFTAEGARTAEGDWSFSAELDDVRYRLDYGLAAILDGNLVLALPAEGRSRLSGELEVGRAVLRRNLDLRQELLRSLFAVDTTGTEEDPLEAIDLDLVVSTAEGVKVKNNLADLDVTWSPLDVSGTLATPLVRGTVDVAPGGMIYTYGQVARIDAGTVVFSGDPWVPPKVDFETTTSLEDPTLRRPPGQIDFEWESAVAADDTPELDKELASGLAAYATGQVSERLGGATRISVQPVYVFSETDPGATLTVIRDLSHLAAVAVAVDLRDTQQQTYIVDLHDLPKVQRLSFQVFTNAEDNEGVTLQQTLELGRGKPRTAERRLRQILFGDLPEGLSPRSLTRAAGFDKDEPLPEGAAFEVEVELAEHLRRRGYPGAEVAVLVEAVGDKKADLVVAIDPGPRVSFAFEGTEPPGALRREITGLYRVDFYEAESIAEMRSQVERALRSEGYVEPEVAIDVARPDDGSRTVTVRADGGRRLRLDEVVFAGLVEGDDGLLAGRFASEVARIELAAGLPEADLWLLSSLRSLGYPEARIAGRELSEDGHRLTVRLDAGRRQEIASVEVRGKGAAVAGLAKDRLPVRAGEPPRADRVAAANLQVHNDLERRGYSEARVRTVLEEAAGGSGEVALVFEVDAGPQYRLETVRFAGLRATRAGWARKLVKLEEDALLDPDRVGQARRHLAGTRLFRSVRTATERGEGGRAAVTFEVEEAPRYAFSYGLRWESSVGTSAVVDVVDRNFLGRGVTVGVRGLYSGDEQAGRLYVGRTGIFGRRLGVELFVERVHETTKRTSDFFDDRLLIDTLEGTLQVSFPFGKRLTSRVYTRVQRAEIREKVPFFPEFPFEETIRFPFVGWQLIHDSRDDRLAPERGLFVSVDLSSTGRVLDSDFDFVRAFSQASHVRRVLYLGRRRVFWAHSYRMGLLTSRDQFPLSEELFRAGGEYSVRGYPHESLADDPRGGEALLVINQELRFDLWRELSGLVFVDLGGAWAAKSDFGSDLFKSVGLGLRAETPIGLLRFDVGFPLDGREEDSSLETYLGFGHAF